LTGTKVPCPSTDPGIFLTTGNMRDFGSFKIPQLRGLRFTAPYFHDNSAATIEEMLHHYTVFFAFANAFGFAGLPPDGLPTSEYPALLAYLNKI
jgi:hypothetical protein